MSGRKRQTVGQTAAAVAALVGEGLLDREIAARLGISSSHARNVRREIGMRKAGGRPPAGGPDEDDAWLRAQHAAATLLADLRREQGAAPADVPVKSSAVVRVVHLPGHGLGGSPAGLCADRGAERA